MKPDAARRPDLAEGIDILKQSFPAQPLAEAASEPLRIRGEVAAQTSAQGR